MTRQHQNGQSQPRPTRQVIVREYTVVAEASERSGRLAALLSMALSRRFGQENLAGKGSLAKQVDYSLDLAVTTDDPSKIQERCAQEKCTNEEG